MTQKIDTTSATIKKGIDLAKNLFDKKDLVLLIAFRRYILTLLNKESKTVQIKDIYM